MWSESSVLNASWLCSHLHLKLIILGPLINDWIVKGDQACCFTLSGLILFLPKSESVEVSWMTWAKCSEGLQRCVFLPEARPRCTKQNAGSSRHPVISNKRGDTRNPAASYCSAVDMKESSGCTVWRAISCLSRGFSDTEVCAYLQKMPCAACWRRWRAHPTLPCSTWRESRPWLNSLLRSFTLHSALMN